MKEILEKSGNFVRGKKSEPCMCFLSLHYDHRSPLSGTSAQLFLGLPIDTILGFDSCVHYIEIAGVSGTDHSWALLALLSMKESFFAKKPLFVVTRPSFNRIDCEAGPSVVRGIEGISTEAIRRGWRNPRQGRQRSGRGRQLYICQNQSKTPQN